MVDPITCWDYLGRTQKLLWLFEWLVPEVWRHALRRKYDKYVIKVCERCCLIIWICFWSRRNQGRRQKRDEDEQAVQVIVEQPGSIERLI